MGGPARVLNMALIGTGGMGSHFHIPAIERSGRVRLVALCDVNLPQAQSIARQHGVATAVADYREVLSMPEVEAVSIVTPNNLHYPIALAALAAGKHVMCEKPLAVTLPEAKEMWDAARASGLKTTLNFRYRWIPCARLIKEIMDSGKLGQVYHVYFNYLQGSLVDPRSPMRWRMKKALAGSGALGDLGSHCIDLVRHLVGEFEAVSSNLTTFTPRRPLATGGDDVVDVDDAATVLGRLANGAQAVINVTRNAPGRGNDQRLEIYGSGGALVYEMTRYDAGADRIQMCLGSAQADYDAYATVRVPPRLLAGPCDNQMAAFINSVLDDTPIEPSFYDGYKCQEILEAAQVSSREGRWVSLPAADQIK